MRKWILKAVVQKGLALFPARHRLNYLFQKYVTKGVQLSEVYLQDRLIHLKHHLEAYQAAGRSLNGKKTLELGTGWYPVIPVGLFLSGANEVYSVDISPLMDRDKILTTLHRFRRARQDGYLLDYFKPVEERWVQLERILDDQEAFPLEKLLQHLCLNYLVLDARHLPLPEHSIDLITSNNTFEHIYPEVLRSILLEFQRVIRTDGVMSHFIDMSDHFAHLDKSISVYHFLRFSPCAWQVIDNRIQPQNRWRISQYRALYQALGIPLTREKNRPGDPDLLAKEPLAAVFSQMPVNELAITHSYVISEMKT